MQTTKEHNERRRVLKLIGSGAGLALAGCATARPPGSSHRALSEEPKGPEVTPAEDLMQEHGVLERLLLIYAEAARRIERGAELDLAVITSAAGIIRHFVEDYHEKLEERFVFPRLEAARREAGPRESRQRRHPRG